MSHISDAVQGVCTALDHCFAAYGDGRLVSTSVRHPMDVDCFDLVVPPAESTTLGFRFDLGAR